jgi:hypothetical protein
VFTRALHWSLSLTRSIQSIPLYPISLRSILILSSQSPENTRDASSGDKLKIALFGDLSLEEAMDLSRDRQILELELECKTLRKQEDTGS